MVVHDAAKQGTGERVRCPGGTYRLVMLLATDNQMSRRLLP